MRLVLLFSSAFILFFFFKHKTAYEMRISDWSSDVCSSDLRVADVLNFGANESLRDDGQVFSCDLTPHGKHRKVITTREPLLGVITAITPFNHPMNQEIGRASCRERVCQYV